MSKWEMVRLGDVTENISSGRNKNRNDNGVYKVYGSTGIIGQTNSFNYNNDAVLVARVGANCGYVHLARGCYDVSDNTLVFEPNRDKLDLKFAYYQLKKLNMNQYAKGAGQPLITGGLLKSLKIHLPPLSVQEKIADILDRTTALIEKRKAQIAKLDLLVKSQFIEMFGNNLADDAVELKRVCSIITDGTHQSPKFTNTGIPFLFVSNIVDNEINYDTKRFISQDEYDTLIKRTPVEIGDILLTIVGSYGNPAVVKSKRDFCFQRHIAYMKPKRDIVNSIYLHSAFLSSAVKSQIEVRVKGIAQKTLNLAELKMVKINLPPIELQNRFADFVRAVEKSKAKMQQGLDELDLLYKSLTKKSFNGEIL